MDNILIKQQVPFTQVPNELLYNPTISFKAKGLWAYMSAKPAGWQFSAKRIAEETKEERKAVLGGLKELAEAGYITAKKLGDGRMEYTLHWEVATAKPVAKAAVVDPKPKPELDLAHPAPVTPEQRRRPVRANYKTDEEFEKAFYAYNSMV